MPETPGSGYADRRVKRLSQLEAFDEGELEAQIQKMREDRALPRLRYHFHKHGDDVEATSEEHYLWLFREHLRRGDLRYFTFIRHTDEQRMWYLVSEDTECVAQYNGDIQSYVSFFRPNDFSEFMVQGSRRWIEVYRGETGWELVE